MKLELSSLDELPAIAKQIINVIADEKIILFVGEMGAGKTTLIKAICQQLGVVSPLSSPTFSLINEYETEAGEIIYHFDFYRLESEEEALDYGLEEYFDSGNICFLEWPERIPSLLPETFFEVKITLEGNKRLIEASLK